MNQETGSLVFVCQSINLLEPRELNELSTSCTGFLYGLLVNYHSVPQIHPSHISPPPCILAQSLAEVFLSRTYVWPTTMCGSPVKESKVTVAYFDRVAMFEALYC